MNEPTNTKRILRILGWIATALYVAIAIAEVIFSEPGIGGPVRGGIGLAFAGCILGGIHLQDRRPMAGAVLASVGAVVGGMFMIWTLLAPALAVPIVVLSVRRAHERSFA